jgi:hypothetical protein
MTTEIVMVPGKHDFSVACGKGQVLAVLISGQR